MSSTPAARRLPLSELTPTEAFVVTVLAEADRPLTRADLERRTGTPTRTLYDVLPALQERDLVTVVEEASGSTPARYELEA